MAIKCGNSIDRLHTITIRWTRSTYFDKDELKRLRDDKECGWYIITKLTRDGYEVPIYIGKAINSIYKRVLQHRKDDSDTPFLKKYGDKYVYIGTVDNATLNTKQKLSKRYHLNRLLLTVESALIQNKNEYFEKYNCNISQNAKYTRWYKLRIKNLYINEALLDHEIDNREHENVYPCPQWWKGQLME